MASDKWLGEEHWSCGRCQFAVSGVAPLKSLGGTDLSPSCYAAAVVSVVLFTINLVVLYTFTSCVARRCL